MILVTKNNNVTFSRCSMGSSCIGIAQKHNEGVCHVIVQSGDSETFRADSTMNLWSTAYVHNGTSCLFSLVTFTVLIMLNC